MNNRSCFWEVYFEAMTFLFDLRYSQKATEEILLRKFSERPAEEVKDAIQHAADDVFDKVTAKTIA